MDNPFLLETEAPLVAIRGRRGGYLQLAPSTLTTRYSALPETMLAAARGWAIALEELGAQRVYWITLSEVQPHLHIHLYPRWRDDEARGLPLFEARDSDPQPEWTSAMTEKLSQWCQDYAVELVPSG